MRDTKGYIYFAIKTDDANIDLLDFEEYLSIQPTKFEKMFQRGKVPKATSWNYYSENLVNPNYFEEIERLITILEVHADEFKKLKLKYPEMIFVLEVVIYMGKETPGLHFSKRTIKFINSMDAVIDCDIYPDSNCRQ